MADAFLIKRVVDAESGERGIERIDMHLVVVPRDRPRKVGQRTDRIVEKIGFERLSNPLFLGRIGRHGGLFLAVLRLERVAAEHIVRIIRVVRILIVLISQNRAGVELSGCLQRRKGQQPSPQHNPQNFFQHLRKHRNTYAQIAAKIVKNQAFGALSGFPERMQSQRTADTTIYKTIITGIAYVRSIIINTILASRKRYRTSFPRQPKPWNLRANMRIGETRSREVSTATGGRRKSAEFDRLRFVDVELGQTQRRKRRQDEHAIPELPALRQPARFGLQANLPEHCGRSQSRSNDIRQRIELHPDRRRRMQQTGHETIEKIEHDSRDYQPESERQIIVHQCCHDGKRPAEQIHEGQ